MSSGPERRSRPAARTSRKIPLVRDPAAIARIRRNFPTFRDFVDDALFHPAWGHYSTGRVRFGEGGHYETFPTALSPLYGLMVARCAFRFWQRAGMPAPFEICEIGAGNGQLCLDVLASLSPDSVLSHHQPRAWKRFASVASYRIVERSPALILRQRGQLGPLAARVAWTRADLSERPARGTPLGDHGFIVANEVLDCLAHHKIVAGAFGEPAVVVVVPELKRQARGGLRVVPGLEPGTHALGRASLPALFSDSADRRHVTFKEVALPASAVPGLRGFLEQYCPELLQRQSFVPYFACPAIPRLIQNSGRLYRRFEALWIDYGDLRPFHLRAAEHRRVFAGPPKSRKTIYDDPGGDDITFMVDFTVAAGAARTAGFFVSSYGPQSALVRMSGVRFDRRARELIIRARALSWLLAVSGVNPEREWQRTGLTWKRSAARGGSLESSVQRSIDELCGRKPSLFKLLVLRSGS